MLVLPAQLTHADAAACSRMLAQALPAEPAAVEVDASALAVFDSSALAVLLECRREALAAGKSFCAVRLPPRLEGLASVYGVLDLLLPQVSSDPQRLN